MIKVLLIGPSITRTKGGIATVIQDVLKADPVKSGVAFTHVVSHVEGSKFEKIWVAFLALLSVISNRNHDIMHIHAASDASIFRKSFFVLLGSIFRQKVILHMHGADFDTFYDNAAAPVKWYLRKVFALCSKFLVLSDFWKNFFDRNFSRDKVEVLHNGVYASDFKACQTMPANLNKFLFLGRLGNRKGIYDLLEAIDILVNKQQHRQLYFYLAGDGDIEQVREIVKTRNLQDNVEVMGWVGDKEKPACLMLADTLILPSYNEGLPMSILEAMAAGKVIISSTVGGIPDLVNHQENGYLIEPGDVQALCEHILHVAHHPDEMTTMAEANVIKINNHYDLPKLHEQLFGIYHGLLNKEYSYRKQEVKLKYGATQSVEQ